LTNQFIPFVFDIFVYLAPEDVNLLQRVQNVMNSNVFPKAMNVFFKRIDFVIKKWLAAQLVGPLSFMLN
jgi:hypothetical protein